MDNDFNENSVTTSEAAEAVLSAMSDCTGAQTDVSSLTAALSSSSSEEDVYMALANRERDLMLAAELGKALLEKNEELQKKNEQLTEEFTQKIEQLTQERHGLKLKLENLEAEYQATVRELQSDITLLQKALEEKQQSTRASVEKNQHYIIEELTQQNEKLSQQIAQAAERERNLQVQLRELHEEMDTRRQSMHEHVTHLDTLTNQDGDTQMTKVCDKKAELEERIATLLRERDEQACSVEESRERINSLENETKRQKTQLEDNEKNMQELQERNIQLQERLSGGSGGHHGNTTLTSLEGSSTLFSELQMCGLAQAMSTESLDEQGAVKIGQQALDGPINYYNTCHVDTSFLYDTDDEDDIECDDDVMEFSQRFVEFPQCMITSTNHESHHSLSKDVHENDGDKRNMWHDESATSNMDAHKHSRENCYEYGEPPLPKPILLDSSSDTSSQRTETSTLSALSLEVQNEELRQEILEVYRQLKHLVMELKGTGDQWSPEAIQLSDMKPGSLLTALKDLRDIVLSSLAKHNDNAADSASLSADLQDYLEHQDMKIQDLKRDVAERDTEVTKVTQQMKVKDEQIQRYAEQVASAQNRISEQRSCIDRLQQQLDKMVDEKCDVTNDEIVQSSRRERDLAREQLERVEGESEKHRRDTMCMNEQLIEAIQQKLDLSQQLELWQVDMQDLIDKQVSRRMREERAAEEHRRLQRLQAAANEKKATPVKKSFSLFSRKTRDGNK